MKIKCTFHFHVLYTYKNRGLGRVGRRAGGQQIGRQAGRLISSKGPVVLREDVEQNC